MLIVKRPPFVRPKNVVGNANKTATTGISILVIVDTIASPAVKDVRTQNVPTYRLFLKLAKQKGNDLLLPKREKMWLVFKIRCIFRSLRYFKMILAYN